MCALELLDEVWHQDGISCGALGARTVIWMGLNIIPTFLDTFYLSWLPKAALVIYICRNQGVANFTTDNHMPKGVAGGGGQFKCGGLKILYIPLNMPQDMPSRSQFLLGPHITSYSISPKCQKSCRKSQSDPASTPNTPS